MSGNLEFDMQGVIDAILQDKKAHKRLRYTHALIKIGQNPSESQMEMLIEGLMPHFEAAKIDDFLEANPTTLIELVKKARHQAWEAGSLEDNFKVLKFAREHSMK